MFFLRKTSLSLDQMLEKIYSVVLKADVNCVLCGSILLRGQLVRDNPDWIWSVFAQLFPPKIENI